MDEIPAPFRAAVQLEVARLLAGHSKRSRNNALRKLKNIYDAQFGRTSEERNAISLFLYGGPIYASWDCTHIFDIHRTAAFSISWHRSHEEGESDVRSSILYSGDGYLDTPERLSRMTTFLRPQRVDSIAVFQVMHHGAKPNWHRGVAGAIQPVYSIFSSDPGRKNWHHPDESVLRDFWPYGATQVDKVNSAGVGGQLCS